MPPAGFEPAIPRGERLDRAATGIGGAYLTGHNTFPSYYEAYTTETRVRIASYYGLQRLQKLLQAFTDQLY